MGRDRGFTEFSIIGGLKEPSVYFIFSWHPEICIWLIKHAYLLKAKIWNVKHICFKRSLNENAFQLVLNEFFIDDANTPLSISPGATWAHLFSFRIDLQINPLTVDKLW